MLKLGIKIWVQTHVSVAHIPNEIHMCTIPHATSRDCNRTLKQLIIPENYMGIYYTWIFDISHGYLKKVLPERKEMFFFLANVIFLILIFKL